MDETICLRLQSDRYSWDPLIPYEAVKPPRTYILSVHSRTLSVTTRCLSSLAQSCPAKPRHRDMSMQRSVPFRLRQHRVERHDQFAGYRCHADFRRHQEHNCFLSRQTISHKRRAHSLYGPAVWKPRFAVVWNP